MVLGRRARKTSDRDPDRVIGVWYQIGDREVWNGMLTPREQSRLFYITLGLMLPGLLVLLMLEEAIEGRNAFALVSAGSLACGAAALAVGAVWALRLQLARPPAVVFIEGTAVLRSIVAGMILLWLVALAFTAAELGNALPASAHETTSAAVAAIASLVGPGSIVAMAGPGYSEYRRAFAEVGDRGRFARVDRRALLSTQERQVVRELLATGEERTVAQPQEGAIDAVGSDTDPIPPR